ncbi:MFS transporter [Plantibacter sp. YIM 135249]|uniref:MFS transporter n=1 Tax=Plantibacter sp. YIM 135249 TaxID=3423918 RepID=UPI003D32DA0A
MSTETAAVTTTPIAPPTSGRAWTMLALGVGAQAAGTVFINTPAFLIPFLHTERGLTLAEAGLLASAPTLGMVFALIAWGALADRIGERWVIAASLSLTAIATVAAIVALDAVTIGEAAQARAGGAGAGEGASSLGDYWLVGVLLLLGGMASAGTNSASGKIVVGWFAKERRGLAMGIRQMAVPLGATIAAVTVPTIAAAGAGDAVKDSILWSGAGAALAVPLVINAVFAIVCAVAIRNPPMPARTVRVAGAGAQVAGTGTSTDAPPPVDHNPYRGSSFLWRIHAVSILLVVPQFTLSTFALVWLVAGLGWEPLAAGVLVGAAQFVGAIGRILVGVLSDRVGSRVRPLRWVALSGTAVMLLLALAGFLDRDAFVAVMIVVATTVAVADNGLAFTSVAEASGPRWSGRALGVQNTGQYIAASIVGPAVGALIGLVGYPLAFAVIALCPIIAVPIVPRADVERETA